MGCGPTAQKVVANVDKVDLSHFDLLKVVGKGGFGKVNAASRRATGELVAIKRINKAAVLKLDTHLSTIWIERDVMSRVKSAFLVNLLHAFQDKDECCLVMPFMKGGDLRYYLNEIGPMREDIARFYAAELVLGLEELHSLNVVYRDLKPDNALLDEEGNLKISDFGIAVQLTEQAEWLASGRAGTTGYQAPEVVSRHKYGFSADFFSLGVTVYELMTCHRPFGKSGTDFDKPMEWFKLSPEAIDLVSNLLEPVPLKRLGCGPRAWADVKDHPWFQEIDWKKLEKLQLVPPHTPDPNRANCSNKYSLEDQLASFQSNPDKVEAVVLTEEQQQLFRGFDYRTDLKALELEDQQKEQEKRRASLKGEQEGMNGLPAGTTSTISSTSFRAPAPVAALSPPAPSTSQNGNNNIAHNHNSISQSSKASLQLSDLPDEKQPDA